MSIRPTHLFVLAFTLLASPVLLAQSQIDGQKAVLIEPVDPDPGSLVFGSISVPGDLPAMNAARPDTIITRDPEPHELVAGPSKQEVLPGPPSPEPIKTRDP